MGSRKDAKPQRGTLNPRPEIQDEGSRFCSYTLRCVEFKPMEVAFCQTLSFNADTFEYEAVAQDNGNATIIKFPIDEKKYSPGDVVVVVSGEEITFHGIIGKIEDGYAFASDPKGSLLAAGVQ